MQDAAGQWVTVNEDMGMPAGKPKTIAVALHWHLRRSRKIRIVTDLCVYWDEIFLSETAAPPDARLQTRSPRCPPTSASAASPRRASTPSASSPTLLYSPVDADVFLESDARPLYPLRRRPRHSLGAVDDRLVIMGSGDELTLRFDVPAAAARRLDARLSAEGGWLGERPRPEHRVLHDGGAAAVPRA